MLMYVFATGGISSPAESLLLLQIFVCSPKDAIDLILQIAVALESIQNTPLLFFPPTGYCVMNIICNKATRKQHKYSLYHILKCHTRFYGKKYS